MEFSSNRLKQVQSRFTTSGLVELLQNHEVMFLSVKQTRMATKKQHCQGVNASTELK